MTKRILLQFVAVLVATLVVANVSHAAFYHIEIADLDPGQPITPPVAVVHGNMYRLFEIGTSATAGLEALAEDGQTDLLVGEALSNPDVRHVKVGGDGPTFSTFKFFIQAEPGDLFSVASMFAKTNDTFIGVSAVMLPGGDTPLVIDAQAHDAGTEQNTGLVADIPAFGNHEVGMEEEGTVQVINQFVLQDAPDAAGPVEFSWPPAARVTITPMPDAIVYDIILTGLSEGQPLTPPVITIHDPGRTVFTLGQMASAGLELLAEEGQTSPLIGELTPLAGVWTAQVGGEAPGFEHMASVIGSPGQLVTITSMFARTNDVFTGVNAVQLPAPGSSETIETVAWDAGTEQNTGLMAHVPLYGGVGGPNQGGVVSEINSYSILDDPGGRLDYTWPPAARVVIRTQASPVEHWSLYR
ncbi:MAG: spondin domain-containing protein [bacterium]